MRTSLVLVFVGRSLDEREEEPQDACDSEGEYGSPADQHAGVTDVFLRAAVRQPEQEVRDRTADGESDEERDDEGVALVRPRLLLGHFDGLDLLGLLLGLSRHRTRHRGGECAVGLTTTIGDRRKRLYHGKLLNPGLFESGDLPGRCIPGRGSSTLVRRNHKRDGKVSCSPKGVTNFVQCIKTCTIMI